jgi:hypothetical protein
MFEKMCIISYHIYDTYLYCTGMILLYDTVRTVSYVQYK